MYHQLGSFKHQKFIVSQLWRLEVWNQGIIRAVLPLITCRGESFLASLLLVFARDPWPPLVSRCITPVAASAVTGCSSCVCVFIRCSFSVCTSLLIRTPITGLRAHPSSVQSHLNGFHLQGPYFQGRCYSEVPQVGKSDPFHPITLVFIISLINSFLILHVCMLSHFSHVWLFMTLHTVACLTPRSLWFSRQEYWNGLPCLPPGDLLYLGI